TFEGQLRFKPAMNFIRARMRSCLVIENSQAAIAPQFNAVRARAQREIAGADRKGYLPALLGEDARNAVAPRSLPVDYPFGDSGKSLSPQRLRSDMPFDFRK